MKFKPGDTVYYVDQFIFTIEKWIINYVHDDYYVIGDGAYIREQDTFKTLSEAKVEAQTRLYQFYQKRRKEIERYED